VTDEAADVLFGAVAILVGIALLDAYVYRPSRPPWIRVPAGVAVAALFGFSLFRFAT
jgi:hypothetical protein